MDVVSDERGTMIKENDGGGYVFKVTRRGEVLNPLPAA
jgi:hypothetical protein